MPTIAVINRSSLITDAQVAATLPSLQRQIDGDFAPIWNTTGIVGMGPAAGAWQFTLQDTISEPGDLGFHIDDNGIVSAIIDVAACKSSGSDWRTCLGHEVLEALADPSCSRMGDGNFASFMCEVADPVEEDVYAIDGVPVANFVWPAYFGWASARYDQMGLLASPAPALRPGGYILQLVNGEWKSTFGERAAVRPGFMASREGGRRAWRQAHMNVGDAR